ncbi:MAG: DUF1828 domain-containing protein [Clostridiaceae bacterium]|jgi:hypothetical protein|nr:DUF1828 domain-containing protein [Clostridiaceae bacterium]
MINNSIDKLEKIVGLDSSLYDVEPGVIQVVPPFRHSDGDPYEIYLMQSEKGNNYVKITDRGMSLMRLSYSEKITDGLLDNIGKLVNQNRHVFQNGIITSDAPIDSLSSYLSSFIQTIAKVMGQKALSKNIKYSTFYEDFEKFVMSQFTEYNPIKDYVPVKSEDDVTVDYMLSPPATTVTSLMIFVFPIKDQGKATLVWGIIQFCLNNNLKFRSLSVCDDFNSLPRKEQKRIANNSDSLLLTVSDFYEVGQNKLHRLSTLS